jgi:phospholipase/lecithinase/hemolysin
MWVFGDTVSTTTANDDPFPFSPTNYWGHRFCNGPVWVEVLAQLQGITYNPSNTFCYYAHDSIELLLNLTLYFHAPGDASTALFVVWVNDADLVDTYVNDGTNLAAWNNDIIQAQTNHLIAIHAFYTNGVRTLLMPTTVDVSKIPEYANLSASTLAFLRQRAFDYNTAFSSTLNKARAFNSGLTIYSPDLFTLMDNVLANPGNYGVANALYLGKPIDALDDPALSNKSTNGPGASYIWWDKRDPTAKLQAVLARYVQYLLSPTPSQVSKITLLSNSNRLDAINIPVGRDGIVQGRTDLITGSWTTVKNIANSANTNQAIFVPLSASPVQFYRLRF